MRLEVGEDPITLADLASEFGVSRERVRQINVSSFEKVQKAMKKRVAAMGTPAPIQVRYLRRKRSLWRDRPNDDRSLSTARSERS